MASRIRLLAIPGAVVVATACGSSTLPAARILEVEAPAQSATQHIGYIGEDLVLSVTGENFSAGIVPNAGNPDDSKTDFPQMHVQRQGSPLKVAVQGTFLSATLFEGTLPTEPGVYDLLLENGDGSADTIVDAFQMGYRAQTYLVLSTSGIEGMDGDANRMDLQVGLLAAGGLPGIWKDELDLRLVPEGDFATIDTAQSFTVPPGETFGPVDATLRDTAVEIVTITTQSPLPPEITLERSFATTEFIAGTPKRARVLTATEVAANLVDTFLVVEDEWGNVATAHAPYQAGNFSLVGCVGGGAVVEPIVVASNAGMAPAQFTCISPGTKTVVFTEDTATGYENAGGIIIFN